MGQGHWCLLVALQDTLPALIPTQNQQGEDNSIQQSGNVGSSPAFSPLGYYRQQKGNSSPIPIFY